MENRRLFVIVLFMAVVHAVSASAQEDRDPIPLKDWAVPFEQVRRTVPETRPLRMAEQALHPSLSAVPSAASHFITVVPCRVVDTRLATGTYGAPKLVGGTSRSFAIPGGPCAGIPIAAAYSVNLTVTQPEADNGFLTVYPTGSTQPLISNLNFNTVETRGNAAIVPANGAGSIDIFTNVSTQVIIDINGYFVEGVVTNLNAGTGLSGGGTGDVIVSIANGGVGPAQVAANAVTTGAIADNAVTGAKILDGSVTSAKIADGTIVSADLAANSVGTRELSLPSGRENLASPVLVAGSNYVLAAANVTLGQTGPCLVTAHAQISSTATNSTGGPYLQIAIQRGASCCYVDAYSALIFPTMGAGVSAGLTRTMPIAMNVNEATKFGCHIGNVAGDWIGDTLSRCVVSWVCF